MEDITRLNKGIETYLLKDPSVKNDFILQSVPASIRELVGEILPEKNIDAWLKDKRAFDGKSALELLSELDTDQLKENVNKIYQAVVGTLTFASVPKLITSDKLYLSVRQ